MRQRAGLRRPTKEICDGQGRRHTVRDRRGVLGAAGRLGRDPPEVAMSGRRKLYIAMGGSVTLGLFFATVLRLILATLVIGLPAVLMGGTLPAAARAVESDDDAGRLPARQVIKLPTNAFGGILVGGVI